MMNELVPRKKWSTKQKWKLTTGTSQSEIFSHDLYHKYLNSVGAKFRKLQCTRPPGKRDFETKCFKRCNKNNHFRINWKCWGLEQKGIDGCEVWNPAIIFFIYLELQSDRTETSIEYQSKNYCEGSNWCRGILWCYSGFKLKNVLYVENNNAQEVSPIFCNISAFERQLKNIW